MKLRNIFMAAILGLSMTAFMACNNNANTEEPAEDTTATTECVEAECCEHHCEGECSHEQCTGECAEKNCEGCQHDGTCCGKEECAKKECCKE